MSIIHSLPLLPTILCSTMFSLSVGIACAQSESNDSTLLPAVNGYDITIPHDSIMPATHQSQIPHELPLYHPATLTDINSYRPISLQISPSFRPGVITSWDNGGVSAFSASQSMPGLMGIELGGISLEQNFGNFTLTAYGEAIHYGYYRGLSRSLGFGGSLAYRFTDNLSLVIFGNYYTSAGAMNPAMAGYINLPSFGGYLDYSFSDKWGVRVGAQSYRSTFGNRWETQPIVMPYFRLSPNNDLGIDVGGILYQLLHSINTNRNGNFSNPTIAPPVTRLSDSF